MQNKTINRDDIHLHPAQAEAAEKRGLHCPVCEGCRKEAMPDRCSNFRSCVPYRCWLKLTWRAVTAPLRRSGREGCMPLGEVAV